MLLRMIAEPALADHTCPALEPKTKPDEPVSEAGTTVPETMRGMPAPGSYIRDLRTFGHPFCSLSAALLPQERFLQQMCFLDNEHGAAARADVATISLRLTKNANLRLVAQQRRVRVFGVWPSTRKHHHIEVQWGAEDGAVETLLVNLYPKSRRPVDEEEEQENAGPRRGGAPRKPRKSTAGTILRASRRSRGPLFDDNDRIGTPESEPLGSLG